jgi:putative molybdopterin biosynthesis protein
MKRKIYLNMLPLEEARRILMQEFHAYRTGEEQIGSRSADRRVTSRPVTARFSSPSFHASAMDGVAVTAQDTFGASDDTPVTLHLDTSQAVPVNTGHPLPEGKNAVIMIENILLSEDGRTGVVRAPIYPWQNVRKVGEDIVATELLFPSNHSITPADIGALLTAGCPQVWVQKKPKIIIHPTGTELVHPGDHDDPLPPGRTIESNSAVLAALAERAGADPVVSAIIFDEYGAIKKRLLESVRSDADIVVINAGSSAGSADYTAQIIEELGSILVHGVTIMPGKPTILGVIEGKPVIGNPGYPVSALISFEQFVVPLLEHMQGLDHREPETIRAILAKNIPSRGGMEEFRRMVTGRLGNRFVSVPLKKGAGAITTITRANSIFRIPAHSEGETKGSEVGLELLRPKQQIINTILCTGSHDLTLDLLHDFLKKSSPAYPLASTHVGSLGGILAVREDMTHMAGTHLLDPETGDYNISSIRQYLGSTKTALFTLAHRQQGFMVLPGNPKNIEGARDLLRPDVTFVNRQAGSGTRVLLDFELEKNDLDRDEIQGYGYEEYTHMSVAVAVLSGKADTGLGILGAARALRLDFVPLTEERYDILIPIAYLETPPIQRVLEIIGSGDFKSAVEQLGGYSTGSTGVRVL